MFRIVKTLFRPAKTVAYHATLAVDQSIVSSRLGAAKRAAPGFISSVVHRTSPTSIVHIETWDTKANYEAFRAANIADITFSRTVRAAHHAAAKIRVSVFSETI